MSQDKPARNDPQRTLVTLEQLSQTIEVMTNVVNRLRQHLSEQLHAQTQAELSEEQAAANAADQEALAASPTPRPEEKTVEAPGAKSSESVRTAQKEPFVVEISQQDGGRFTKDGKTLH